MPVTKWTTALAVFSEMRTQTASSPEMASRAMSSGSISRPVALNSYFSSFLSI